MQFSSYIFILAFLPIMVLVYFLLNKISITAGKIAIIAGSVIFYAYTDLSTLVILGISLGINFLFAKLIERVKWKKVFMFIPVIINVGLLLYYKYTNFVIVNANAWFGKDFPLKELILPIGISFFTFQQIAYIVAVYRNEIKKTDAIDYISFILYFPKLLMGPLMDPVDFVEQYNNAALKKVDWNNIASGLKIFSFGLLKKLLLADTFARAVSWGFSNYEAATPVDWILVTLFYTFEIYFDFSGYSDMAVGISKMLNITLPINFDSPYKAISIRDFWKRWHISLTKFLTKYIFIPLGGSRKGLLFTCLNTMIVFLVSGIWHGANWTFILWGLLHGAFSILDRFIDKSPKKIFEPARWLLTFIIVNVLWLLFRAESVQQWVDILKRIVTLGNTTVSDGLITSFSFPESEFLFKIIPFLGKLNTVSHGFIMNAFIVASFIICLIPENNYRNKDKISGIAMVLAAIAFVWGVTCLGAESVFVYFNF
ncbi:MAG: MBOAT family protein [Eubacterium sp.]|nr:MBOAT family protein [Eubacterium sp.]